MAIRSVAADQVFRGQRIQLVNPENWIDKWKREGHKHQFLRELCKNSLEAGATKIEFAPEWKAVRDLGVYRLWQADNGCGMTPGQLRHYIRTLGDSTKGLKSNFGIGGRVSLVTWNMAGVLYLSWTPESPEGCAILLVGDDETGEVTTASLENQYGEREEVVSLSDPMYEEWAELKPDWIEDHGTVVVCFGNTGEEHTFFGPEGYSDEQGAGLKYIASYLNTRFWDLPDPEEVEIRASVFFNKRYWPERPTRAEGYQSKIVKGLKYYFTKSGAAKHKRGEDDHIECKKGSFYLSDGTLAEWYYRLGPLGDNHAYGIEKGLIGVRYEGEIYETKRNFKHFGVINKDVSERICIVFEPPHDHVYSYAGRNKLAWKDGTGSTDLPWERWALEFAENLPDVVRDEQRKMLDTVPKSEDFETRKRKIIQQARQRIRKAMLVLDPDGDVEVQVDIVTKTTRRGGNNKPGGEPTGEGNPNPLKGVVIGRGEKKARARRVSRLEPAVPTVLWVEDASDFECDPRFPAEYQPRADLENHPHGVVFVRRDFHQVEEIKKKVGERVFTHHREDAEKLVEDEFEMRLYYYLATTSSMTDSKMPEAFTMGEVKDDLWSPQGFLAYLLVDKPFEFHVLMQAGKKYGGQGRRTEAEKAS